MDKLELLDIVAPLAPPPAPPPYGWIALGTVLAILIICGALYLAWRRSRDRRAALAQLRRTAHALRQLRVDPRTAAFQTGWALRRVFRTPPAKASGAWTHYVNALDQARFAPTMPSTETCAQLLVQARHFLRAQC